MRSGDYIFGISPAELSPRRVVFVAQIEERITFKEAYIRFPGLHGPIGPIHVRPIQGMGSFPTSNYEPIPGSMHEDKKKWQRDLATCERDAFFVCSKRDDWLGRWLGRHGPEIDEEILIFLKTCSVHGASRLLIHNINATLSRPIAYGGRSIGLHLETNQPEALIKLCRDRITAKPSDLDRLPLPQPSTGRSAGLGCSKSSPTCS